ncbi:WD domain G-beta repeat [Carpediemonas membranifera]|uniref:WD domain G-beta repeat n=1 Tax=Carpediemonas membranifera TaxID=201153 RepID=A0A8J6AVN0_9EUKA|nr:WD domain G-beta repeat [Carpediemonas membranifera]|eukprot:KAG9395926.1 WD domain G-beta repeat [Carpediemonas membranifera]
MSDSEDYQDFEDDDEFETASDHSSAEEGSKELPSHIEEQFIIRDLDTGRVINLLEDSATENLAAPLTRISQLREISKTPVSPIIPGRRIPVSKKGIRAPVITAIQELQTIREHVGPVWSLARSADSSQIASGGRDQILRIWDVGNIITPASTHIGHTADILDITWSTGGRLITASSDGTARLWTAGQEGPVETLAHPAHVMSADIHPADPQCVVTASADGVVRLIDVGSKRVLAKGAAPGMPTVVRFCPSGGRVVVGTVTGHLKVLDGASLAPLASWAKQSAGCVAGLVVPDDNTIIASSGDSRIRVFSGDTFICRQTYAGHSTKTTVARPSVSADGRLLCSGSDKASVFMWPMNSGVKGCLRFRIDGPAVSTILLGNPTDEMGGVMLVTGDEDGTMRLFGRGSV